MEDSVRQKISHAVLNGKPHPYQGSMEKLLASSGALNEMHKRIFEAAKAGGLKKTANLVDTNALRALAQKNGDYAALRAIVQRLVDDTTASRNKAKQPDIAPPPATELYGRFDPGSEIVDVGTGDSKRLIRYKQYFAKVVCIDVKLQEAKEVLPPTFERIERSVTVEDHPVASFNVYNQMSIVDKAILEQNDGVHIAPHQGKLLQDGLARKRADGTVVAKMGEVSFLEQGTDAQGVQKGSYYVGFNTYREDDFNLIVGRQCKLEAARGKYKRVCHPIPVVEPTWKVDGRLYELKMDNGRGYMTDRVGKGWFLRSENKKKFGALLEVTDEAVFLLRIKNYHGFVPFHGLAMLEKFVAKVKPTLQGRPIRCVERVQDPKKLPLFPVDGIVIRDNEVDYVFNFGVSLDIVAGEEDELVEFLAEKRGCRARVEGVVEGVTTAVVRETRDGFADVVFKPRDDKLIPDRKEQWTEKFELVTVEGLYDQYGTEKMAVAEEVCDESDVEDDVDEFVA